VPLEVRFVEAELRDKLLRLPTHGDAHQEPRLAPFQLAKGTELEVRIPKEFFNGDRKLQVTYTENFKIILYKTFVTCIVNRLLIKGNW
jgi:hypothetical protein